MRKNSTRFPAQPKRRGHRNEGRRIKTVKRNKIDRGFVIAHRFFFHRGMKKIIMMRLTEFQQSFYLNHAVVAFYFYIQSLCDIMPLCWLL